MLRFAGGLLVLVASFFVTLGALKYWNSSPLTEPAYDAAALPRLRVGQTLDLRQTKSALLSGWSRPESGGVWSNGRAAFIGFVVDGSSATQVVVRATAYKEQKVQVWSGTKKLGEYYLKDSSAELAIPLQDVNVSNGTPVVLGFYLPDATSPAKQELGRDTRELGLLVTVLEISS
jgi:hypothetical protein